MAKIERVGLAASLILNGALLAETVWTRVVDNPATRNDIVKLEGKAIASNKALEANQKDIALALNDSRTALSEARLALYRGCVNEDFFRMTNGFPAIPLSECVAEGEEWIKSGVLEDENFVQQSE